MMSIECGEYYGIGGLDLRVWELFKQSIALTNIVQVIFVEFEVEGTACGKDMRDIISDFYAHGLVSAG